MQRIFVVGCPRSGTTLVQALLARHPLVYALPETGFFAWLYGELAWRWGDRGARPRRRRLRHRFDIARSRARKAMHALRARLPEAPRPRPLPWRTHGCARRFVALLDAQAAAAGRALWVEKTPYHLLYIPEIERLVPQARFVHVIRRGEDVLASVADANLRYDGNDAFGGGIVHWAQRWNRAARIHLDCAGRPQHHFVFLDDLIADLDVEWRRLCAFLGLDAELELDDRCAQPVADLDSEPWKRAAADGRPRRAERKAERLFGPQTLDWLRQRLVPYQELRRACAAGRDARAAPEPRRRLVQPA
ncbi:sulfotransferase family protein [Fulvimonas soli]|jgi:hypothetical protein|uniref:Sulfotransferase family protein n=1 Tax=Fulvimonas soli TaxID=155197 RepID=A0A316I5T8_9GAMM|nr:sulfotransferase [Fulvimonas soli]PWK85837.1 sulfotransferase family protein [Fulvimonas soli]TNY27257.1 sulfotransferase family protein [Fulvimonas soli]